MNGMTKKANKKRRKVIASKSRNVSETEKETNMLEALIDNVAINLGL
jgi:hypothetical protein